MSVDNRSTGTRTCEACKLPISTELQENLKREDGPVYCEYCGKELTFSKEGRVLENEESSIDPNELLEPLRTMEKAPQIFAQNSYKNVRFFLHHIAYEMIIDPLYKFETREEDNFELNERVLRIMTSDYKKLVKKAIFPEALLQSLAPVNQDEVLNCFRKIQDNIRDRRRYRQEYESFFREIVNLTYQLIACIKRIEELSGFELEVARNLQWMYGFQHLNESMTYYTVNLSNIFAEELYDSLIHPDCLLNLDEFRNGVPFSIAEELGTPLYQLVLNKRLKSEWKEKFNKTDWLRFKSFYKEIAQRVLEDQLYDKTFVGYMHWLIRTVVKLMTQGQTLLDKLQKGNLEDAFDARESELIESLNKKPLLEQEPRLSKRFKKNLKKLLSRAMLLYLLQHQERPDTNTDKLEGLLYRLLYHAPKKEGVFLRLGFDIDTENFLSEYHLFQHFIRTNVIFLMHVKRKVEELIRDVLTVPFKKKKRLTSEEKTVLKDFQHLQKSAELLAMNLNSSFYSPSESSEEKHESTETMTSEERGLKSIEKGVLEIAEKEEKSSSDKTQEKTTILTRTYSLIPINKNGVIRGLDKKKVYKHFTDSFVKMRDLKNVYVKILFDLIRKGKVEPFYKKGKTSAKTLYNKLLSKNLRSPSFQGWELKERARRALFYEVFDIVRNWLIRTETMGVLCTLLSVELRKESAFSKNFMRGRRSHYAQLKPFFRALKESNLREPFKKSFTLPSVHSLNNLLFQLRNLLLRHEDISLQELQQTPLKELTPLQAHVKTTLNSFHFTENLGEKIARGFKKKKNGKVIAIQKEELVDYWFRQYFRSVSRLTGGQAKTYFSNLKNITALNNKKKLTSKQQEELDKLMNINERRAQFLELYLGKLPLLSLEQYKGAKKEELRLRKERMREELHIFSQEKVHKLIQKAVETELDMIENDPNALLFKKLFMPRTLSFKIPNISLLSFEEYLKAKFQNKFRELLKELFLTEDLRELVGQRMKVLSKELVSLLSLPKCKRLSIQQTAKDEKIFMSELLTGDVKKIDFGNIEGRVGFKARKFQNVKIVDSKAPYHVESHIYKSRLEPLVKEFGFTPRNPTLTLTNRKLLLHLPMEKMGQLLKPDSATPKEERVMGVDLGVVDFAVASIRDNSSKILAKDKKHMQEVAHYFLGASQLFDHKLDPNTKKWLLQDRFKCPPCDQPSHVKEKLVRLRSEIQAVQRKLDSHKSHMDRIYKGYREKLMGLSFNQLQQLHKNVNRLLKQSKKKSTMKATELARFLAFENYHFNRKEMKKLNKVLHRLLSHFKDKEPILNRYKPTYRHRKSINMLQRRLSLLWNKVNKYNRQLIQLVSHFLIALALAHRVSVLKMEDLKWSSHSEKKKIGGYLAFWQAHWFHAGVQDAVELRCHLCGIRFERVDARYSSQTCSSCGARGIRSGKAFSCADCGLKIDADLNAARVISQRSFPSSQMRALSSLS